MSDTYYGGGPRLDALKNRFKSRVAGIKSDVKENRIGKGTWMIIFAVFLLVIISLYTYYWTTDGEDGWVTTLYIISLTSFVIAFGLSFMKFNEIMVNLALLGGLYPMIMAETRQYDNSDNGNNIKIYLMYAVGLVTFMAGTNSIDVATDSED